MILQDILDILLEEDCNYWTPITHYFKSKEGSKSQTTRIKMVDKKKAAEKILKLINS